MPTEIKAQPITKPGMIVVEGLDDKAFFEALLTYSGITDMEVRKMNGNRSWSSRLRVQRETDGFERVRCLGLVQDCDDRGMKPVFQSVRDNLKQAGLPVPKDVMKRSTPQDDLTTAVFLFEPLKGLPGMLETTCLQAFEDDPAYSCVEPFFECLNAIGQNPHSVTDLQKARLEVFLAAKIADPRLNIAVKQSWWPWDHAAFDGAKDFVRLVAGLA